MRAEPTLDQSFDTAALLGSVRRLEQRLSDSIDGGLEDLGLTMSLYLSLDALDREPRVHASQLARNLGITRQSVHALVAKLRRMDLVDLLPLDLGVRGLLLTDLGRRRLNAARDAVQDVVAPLHDDLSPRELDGLIRLAERCVHALRPRPLRWWLD
jgi:DNA-binding MarR family transcriptional regulator